MVPAVTDEPRVAVRKAAEAALEASDRLYEIAAAQNEVDAPTDESMRATDFLQEAAHEIRRHALWLYAETEIGAFGEPPEERR
jgi:predicted phage gp36 major capsid-like protein